MSGVRAVFEGSKAPRLAHYADAGRTLCGRDTGRGSGFVYDGDYGKRHTWCNTCVQVLHSRTASALARPVRARS